MTIKMILATGLNGELGINNHLLENIPADMEYFKKMTTNQVVVMGNNTMNSLPFKDGLPNRLNVVLSNTIHKTPFLHEGVPTYINNLERFLEWGNCVH